MSMTGSHLRVRARSLAIVTLLLTGVMGVVGVGSALATSPDSIAVSASSSNVAMGGTVTYTVVANNASGNTATFNDQINGLTGLAVTSSAGDGTCTQSAGLVTCQAPVSPSVTTVTITGTVTAAGGSVLHNVATMYDNPTEPVVSATGGADVTVNGGTVPPGPGSGTPDLVTSIVAPSTVPAGGALTYTLVVGNQGTGNANGITVVDTLPAGLSSPAVTNATSLFGCSIAGQTVTCTGGRIDAGATATITIAGTAASGPLLDQAVVDPYDTIPESNYNNNTSQATTTIAAAPAASPLNVAITASPTPDVAQGATLTYTVKLTNNGSSTISDIGLVVPTQGLDPNSLAVTAIGFPPPQNQSTAQACGTYGSVIECFMSDNDATELYLAPGQSSTVTITGTVVAPPAQRIVEVATAVGGSSNSNSNSVISTGTVATMVKPAIDLTITKASLPPTVNAAAALQYQYVVGNSGLNTASGVVIRDPLPAAILPPHGGYTFNITYSSAFGSGFACAVDASNVLTCTGGVLPGQSTATITVNLIAPETTGQYTSVVQVDPNNTIPESDKNNNSATATTTVVPGADLVADGAPCTTSSTSNQTVAPGPGPVCQSVDFNPVATSGTLDYTITVPNAGTQDVTGVVVQDTLPAGTTFRNATGDHNFTCSDSGQTVTCVGGIINGTYTNYPNGIDTATITISVFAPAAPGPITNEVRLDPGNQVPEYNKANNISYLTTQVAVESGPGNGNYIDLSIPTLTANPTTVAPNGTIAFTLVVQNTGTEPAFNVEVQDTLPAGARFRSALDTTAGGGGGGFTCSASGQVVTCTGGELDAASGGVAGQRTIVINAFAPPAPTGTGGAVQYTDTAVVDPNNAIPEADEQNNTASTQFTVDPTSTNGTYINLALTSSEQIPTTFEGTTGAGGVLPGAFITYMLTVKNSGSELATGVTLDDTIPANTTFVSATANTIDAQGNPSSTGNPSFTCTQASSPPGTVHCVNGTVGTGAATDTITIVVSAPDGPDASGMSVPGDQAVVNPDDSIPESTYADNTTTTNPVMVLSNVDLTISQDASPSVGQNQTSDYKLTVTNTNIVPSDGSATVYGVEVHDPIPQGLIVENISSQNNAFACQVSENPVNVVDCTGTLAPGASNTIDIQVFVTASDPTVFSNDACVNPNHTVIESNYDNNCSTASTNGNMPDLGISQSASLNTISPGQNEIYTIGVENTGQAAIPAATGSHAGVTVTDQLPFGLTYVSASGTNGFSCTAAAPTSMGTAVTCVNSASFAVGETTTIKVTATVTSSATGPFANLASVTGVSCDSMGNCTPLTADSDDSSTVSVSLSSSGIDLVAQSLTANPDPVAEGGILTYVGVVSNNGTQDTGTAGNVDVQLKLPAGFAPSQGGSLKSYAASGGFACTYNASSTPNIVDCTGDLAAGASTKLTVQEIVPSGTAGTPQKATLAATLGGGLTESDYTNNTQNVTTTVAAGACTAPCVDLVTSTPVATPSEVKDLTGSVTYNFAVGNAGTDASQQTWIEFDVGQGFSLTSAKANNGFECATQTPLNSSLAPLDTEVVCWQTTNPSSPAMGECDFTFAATPHAGDPTLGSKPSPDGMPLNCNPSTGPGQSAIAGGAGVTVSVTGTWNLDKTSTTFPYTANAWGQVFTTSTEFQPNDSKAREVTTTVDAPGPASRGASKATSTTSKTGSCKTVSKRQTRRGKRGAKKVKLTCTATHKRTTSHRKHAAGKRR